MPDQMDPLDGSSWSAPGTVAGFRQSPPDEALLACGARERTRVAHPLALDIGCGAADMLPLAAAGWDVIGVDSSVGDASSRGRTRPGGTPAAPHAIRSRPDGRSAGCRHVDRSHHRSRHRNLARSAAEFRAGVREAARVARSGAALFVFTFSRNTLPTAVSPVAGEPFVFTEFSGQPQCFLTAEQLVAELGVHGFDMDPDVPLRELNVPRPGTLRGGGPPVIYEECPPGAIARDGLRQDPEARTRSR